MSERTNIDSISVATQSFGEEERGREEESGGRESHVDKQGGQQGGGQQGGQQGGREGETKGGGDYQQGGGGSRNDVHGSGEGGRK